MLHRYYAVCNPKILKFLLVFFCKWRAKNHALSNTKWAQRCKQVKTASDKLKIWGLFVSSSQSYLLPPVSSKATTKPWQDRYQNIERIQIYPTETILFSSKMAQSWKQVYLVAHVVYFLYKRRSNQPRIWHVIDKGLEYWHKICLLHHASCLP